MVECLWRTTEKGMNTNYLTRTKWFWIRLSTIQEHYSLDKMTVVLGKIFNNLKMSKSLDIRNELIAKKGGFWYRDETLFLILAFHFRIHPLTCPSCWLDYAKPSCGLGVHHLVWPSPIYCIHGALEYIFSWYAYISKSH